VYPWVPALVEGEDAHVEARVLADDLLGVIVSVKRVHEDEGNVATVRLVQALNLKKKLFIIAIFQILKLDTDKILKKVNLAATNDFCVGRYVAGDLN
jgi:hypothetical protein